MRRLELTGMDASALAAVLLTVVLWASAFVGIRAAGADLSPGSIALGRLTIGTLALGVLVATRPWVPVARQDLVLIAAAGLTWFAIYNLAINQAEHTLDAGTASMLVNTGPIFIALLAGLFLGEGFPRRLLLGCGVAFGGTLVIGFATSSSAGSGTPALGVALCLVAAVAYAVGVTFQKPALRRVPALQVTWLACLVGALVCLPFAPGLAADLGRARPTSIAWLVYLGLFPTSIAFTAWAFALSRTAAGRLGSTTYLVPAVAIVLGGLLLGEAPPLLAIVGGGMSIAGVVLARSHGRPRSVLGWRSRRAAAEAE